MTKNILLFVSALSLSCTSLAVSALAQVDMKSRPVLVITNEKMPATQPMDTTARPARAPVITADQVVGASYYEPTETVVGRKVDELRTDLFALQGRVSGLSDKLRDIQNRSQGQSAEYNASIATINTQLQSGTTPGNPRLVQRLSIAEQNLDALSENVADLNTIAVEIANTASVSSFLLENARAAYGLSGAIEEDHARLAQLEDQINGVVVNIDRLLNNVNDDITRSASFLSSERSNLRTVSLAVTNGDMYGKSLANKTFSASQSMGDMVSAPVSDSGMYQPASYAPAASSGVPGGRRQLAKIRFDNPDVNFEQPVYLAVNEALEKFPSASFDIVAVHPTGGNAAQNTIESTRARRNAERVMRSLTQMGLGLERINLSYAPGADAATNEVHIFIK